MTPQVGDVVSVFTDQSYDEKWKYIVLVGIHSEDPNQYLGVFINSKKYNQNHVDFELTSDRKFLDKSSYVDCGDPKRFSKAEIVGSIQENQSNHRGSVVSSDLELIKETIKSCNNVKRVLKKYFL